MSGNPLRSAAWAMFLGLGLVLLAAISDPARARNLILAERARQNALPGLSEGESEELSLAQGELETPTTPAFSRPNRVSNSPAVKPETPSSPQLAMKGRPTPQEQSEERLPPTSPAAPGEPEPYPEFPLLAQNPNSPWPAAPIGRTRPIGDPDSPVKLQPYIEPNETLAAPSPTWPNVPELTAQGYPSGQPARPGNGSPQMETYLVHLQRTVDQLAQNQIDQRAMTLQLTQTEQLLRQIQHTNQLQELERKVREMQQTQGFSPLPGDPVLPSAPAFPGTLQPGAPAITPPRKNATPGKMPSITARPVGEETFTLQIQDAALSDVLEMLGQMMGLNMVIGRGITGTVSLNLAEVTAEEAFEAVLRSNGLVAEREGNLLYVLTPQEAQARKDYNRKILTKIYRPQYISVKEMQALITPILTPAIGKVSVTSPSETGLANDPEVAGGDQIAQQDALLVQDYPNVIEEIDQIMLDLDVPPMQVVIEAMILRVRLTDDMQFGVNFALLNQQSNQLLVSGLGNVLNSTTGIPSNVPQNIVPAQGNFLNNSAGLKYGMIRGDVGVFIDALETLSDTNLVASPQLRVLNKQKAQLIIGRRLSYITRTFQDNQTIESVNFLDSGTRLIIRPFVSPDGMVRMEVHPERSTASRNPETQLPDLETTEVTTNVMVRDGTTVVIGGLIEEETTESYQRVPLLGAIPWLGAAFRNKQESIDRSELIVLITPRIVTPPLDEQQGELASQEYEERATFFRDNLTPFNRRNLARMKFERAWELYHQGDLVRAHDYVMHALRESPNDLNALRLKQQIESDWKIRRQEWLGMEAHPEPLILDEQLIPPPPPPIEPLPELQYPSPPVREPLVPAPELPPPAPPAVPAVQEPPPTRTSSPRRQPAPTAIRSPLELRSSSSQPGQNSIPRRASTQSSKRLQ